jgi:hypothetical protein
LSLNWSTLPGAPGRCAVLPDGRVAYVRPARSGSGYAARLAARIGATPHAFALYAAEADAVAWVERIGAGCRSAA